MWYAILNDKNECLSFTTSVPDNLAKNLSAVKVPDYDPAISGKYWDAAQSKVVAVVIPKTRTAKAREAWAAAVDINGKLEALAKALGVVD